MKNIFKKNHIIITALAIMIVIAGYLSFTNRDAADKKDAVAVSDSEDYEEFTQVDGEDVLAESEDDTKAADVEDAKATEGEAVDKTEDAEATDKVEDAKDTEATDVTAETENSEKLAVDKKASEVQKEDSEEVADISDEDLTASSKEVTDNGELDLEEGVPGEAVLANAAIDAGYFISSRIDREQVRAKNKELYREIMESTEVTEKQKQQAIDAMLELADIADKENITEKMLEAKGFDGAVVFINDDKAEVVVNAKALTDQQLAIIEDVVKDKTGIAVKNIEISPVVVSE
jgi:stage III sporulation protein AH